MTDTANGGRPSPSGDAAPGSRPPSVPRGGDRWGRAVLLAALGLGLLYFGLKAYTLAWENRTPGGDQIEYLSLGQGVAEGRGFGTASNRGPLFPFLLAPLASPTLGYFARAKGLIVVLSSLGLAILTLLCWRRESPWTALWWTALAGHNVIFLWYSGRVYPESLVLLLSAAAFLAGPDGKLGGPRLGPALSGFLLGVAWLGKATVSLLAPALFLAWLAGPGPWRRRWRPAALFAAAFLLAASPWLVRNVLVFGNPLHTTHTTSEIWMDRWDEIYSEKSLEGLPTAGDYFRSHSPHEIAERVTSGMRSQAMNFVLAVEVTLKPIVPWDAPQKLFALALVCLATVAVVRERGRATRVGVGLATTAFFLFFSWDAAIVDSPRFLVPLIPWLLLPLARFLGDLSRRHVPIAAPAALAAWALAGLVGNIDWPLVLDDPRGLGTPPRSHAEIVEWIQTRLGPEDVLCYGPEESLYSWVTGRNAVHLLTDSSPEGLRAYFAARRVGYWIVDPPSLRRRPYLAPYFALRRDGGLEPRGEWLARDFPYLTLVHETSVEPNHFLVFRVDPARAMGGEPNEGALR